MENKNKAALSVNFSLGVILSIIFMVLKLCNVITWSWFWVLFPFILELTIAIVVLIVCVIVVFISNRED